MASVEQAEKVELKVKASRDRQRARSIARSLNKQSIGREKRKSTMTTETKTSKAQETTLRKIADTLRNAGSVLIDVGKTFETIPDYQNAERYGMRFMRYANRCVNVAKRIDPDAAALREREARQRKIERLNKKIETLKAELSK